MSPRRPGVRPTRQIDALSCFVWLVGPSKPQHALRCLPLLLAACGADDDWHGTAFLPDAAAGAGAAMDPSAGGGSAVGGALASAGRPDGSTGGTTNGTGGRGAGGGGGPEDAGSDTKDAGWDSGGHVIDAATSGNDGSPRNDARPDGYGDGLFDGSLLDASMSACGKVETALADEQRAVASCEETVDCTAAYNAFCAAQDVEFMVGCYLPVNGAADLSALRSLEAQYQNEACIEVTDCDCAEPPAVKCEAERCVFDPPPVPEGGTGGSPDSGGQSGLCTTPFVCQLPVCTGTPHPELACPGGVGECCDIF